MLINWQEFVNFDVSITSEQPPLEFEFKEPSLLNSKSIVFNVSNVKPEPRSIKWNLLTYYKIIFYNL